MRKGQSDTAAEADRYVGARLRERRVMLGLTQQELAACLGITYQQQHKYEQGINRISAARLYQAAGVLGVPIGFFYDGIGEGGGSVPSRHQRRSLEMSRVFGDIDELRLQVALIEMARALAEPGDGQTTSATSENSLAAD